MGASNACIACHQPRHTPPSSTEAEYTISSSHWGPHHGPQATLVEGIQGYEFSQDGIVAAGTSEHSSEMSCVACHMTDNGHTFEPAATASATCTECHSEYTEVTGFASGMTDLAAKLEAVVGWEYVYIIDRDTEGDPILDDGDLVFLDAVGGNVVDDAVIMMDDDGTTPLKQDVVGAVLADSPNPGFYGQGATFTSDEAGAAHNYLFLLEDKSNGVHNPTYAKALIVQSNEAL
jgi:hypothetical protein